MAVHRVLNQCELRARKLLDCPRLAPCALYLKYGGPVSYVAARWIAVTRLIKRESVPLCVRNAVVSKWRPAAV